MADEAPEKALFSKRIELRGHIIDSLILPHTLDEIMDRGGEFTIEAIEVGRQKYEPSYARLEIRAPSADTLSRILDRIERLGAVPIEEVDAILLPAPADGVFPEDFYSTTSLETFIRLGGQWTPVRYPEMDCGILVEGNEAQCIPINDVKAGQLMVVGRTGIKVLPLERPRTPSPMFAFMGSTISTEKPKAIMIADIAEQMRSIKERRGGILVVAGPAVVHTGAGEYLSQLIAAGYVDVLFAGNAMAAHDIEWALYGTSLGVSLTEGTQAEGGHQHHLRAINAIRRIGGIKKAVDTGFLTKGIMYACIQSKVPFVLAGSIRDDGPLPEVITDVLEAQSLMRRHIRQGVELTLMLSTMLHSIATSNLLPGQVTLVCVDINPAVVTKLMDRGGIQTIGLVMDVGSFLRELVHHLE